MFNRKTTNSNFLKDIFDSKSLFSSNILKTFKNNKIKKILKTLFYIYNSLFLSSV